MNNIHFILTGGTIEKTYDPITEKTQFKQQGTVEDYLRDIVKVQVPYDVTRVCQVDSLHITEDIRSDILNAVQGSDARRIVIVHGTSTMADTAQYLAVNLPHNDKSIVLTGAMIPIKEFAMSDGGFNLGYAISSVQNADAGVFVAMNATLFEAGSVVKNIDVGLFEGKP